MIVDVYILASHRDREIIADALSFFERRNHKCWHIMRDFMPGADLKLSYTNAMKGSTAAVAIFTKQGVTNALVDEFRTLVSLKKPIVAIVADDVVELEYDEFEDLLDRTTVIKVVDGDYGSSFQKALDWLNQV